MKAPTKGTGFDVGSAILSVTLGVALIGAYVWYISPAFSYYGYTYRSPSALELIAPLILIFFVSGMLPSKLERPSAAILWILHVFVCIPTLVTVPLAGIMTADRSLTLSFMVATIFLLMSWLIRSLEKNIRDLGKKGRVSWFQDLLPKPGVRLGVVAVSVSWSLLVYAYFGATLGWRMNLVSLLDVYDVRESYVTEAAGVPLMAYLVSWQANIINPYLVVQGFVSRRWFLFGFGLLGQVVLYAQTGLKSVIYSIPILILALFLLKGKRIRSARLIPFASLIAVGLSIALDELTGTIYATSFVVRRAFTTPGLLTGLYVEFFRDHEHTYLSQSLLSGVFDYPYDFPIPIIIGSIWNDYGSSANANFVADAFANFGWPGVIGFALMLCFIMRFIDTLTFRQLPEFTIPMIVLPSIVLANSALFTSLLTHGVLVLMILFFMISGQGNRINCVKGLQYASSQNRT